MIRQVHELSSIGPLFGTLIIQVKVCRTPRKRSGPVMLTATRPKDRVWLRINGRSRMNSLSRCKAPSVPHGTAFTEEERTKLGLQNLLSTHVNRTRRTSCTHLQVRNSQLFSRPTGKANQLCACLQCEARKCAARSLLFRNYEGLTHEHPTYTHSFSSLRGGAICG